jgi:hypothetical protein
MSNRKQIAKKILLILGLLVVGAGVGYLGAQFGMGLAKDKFVLHPILLIAFLLPAYFIVVGFHEGGHALAGILMNFDFRMYVVGPFLWEKENGHWKFKWNRNVNISGGMVICLPTTSENLSKRFSFYAAGGPIASLLLVALAYTIYWLIDHATISGSALLSTIALGFGMVAFLSLAIFIVTAIPLQTGGFYSDGARIIRFLRGGDIARFDLLLLKIITSSASGVRPRELVVEELEEAKVLAKKLNAPMGVYLHGYHYQVAFDNDDVENAEIHLQNYINEANQIPDGIRCCVWLDAAFFYAAGKRDLQTAERFWEKYKPAALIPKAQVLATQAAINLLKNETEKGSSALDASLNEIANMLDKGIGIALKDRLLKLKNDSAQK